MAASERAGFSRFLYRMENGDVMIATKLNRLDRDGQAKDSKAAGDARYSGTPLARGGVDLTSAAGKRTRQVISVVTECDQSSVT